MMIVLLLSGCSIIQDDETKEAILLQDQEENQNEDQEPAKEQETQGKMIVVYVCGKVKKEGVVTLPAGSRIYQAIETAGGMTEDAAPSWLNLAQVLTDGARVYVPGKDEISENSSKFQDGTVAESTSQEMNNGKVNLNQASAEELMTLPGIGEAKAEAILQYRAEHGNFDSIEEIKNISGIKDGVFEKIKDKITV